VRSPEERIRDLVRSRAVEEADAARLLEAVRPASDRHLRRSRNPYERWSGERTSLAGVVIALAAFATSRMGIRYDGALDLHVVGEAIPLTTAIVDQLVAFPFTAAVLWAAARLLSRGARFVDILGLVGTARLPAVMAAVPIALLVPHISKDPAAPNAALFAVIALALVAIGSQITLLVVGFRATTGREPPGRGTPGRGAPGRREDEPSPQGGGVLVGVPERRVHGPIAAGDARARRCRGGVRQEPLSGSRRTGDRPPTSNDSGTAGADLGAALNLQQRRRGCAPDPASSRGCRRT
jgi:hypothetical protein